MRITEASEYLGVSINTLKHMADSGQIKCYKTNGGHRRFKREVLDEFTGVERKKAYDKVTMIYARCSTQKQKENLERQKQRLIEHAQDKQYTYEIIEELSSGINEKRKGLHKLVRLIFEGRVERILIEYKDRLARFGYEYLWLICKYSGVEIEIINDREKKYEEELAEDIMKILTCYSARYYGARGGRKKGSRKPKTEAETVILAEIAKGPQEIDFDGI